MQNLVSNFLFAIILTAKIQYLLNFKIIIIFSKKSTQTYLTLIIDSKIIFSYVYSLVAADCAQGMIQRPAKSVWQVVQNDSLQDMSPDSHEAVVQIQPQKIRLSLKPRTYHSCFHCTYMCKS